MNYFLISLISYLLGTIPTALIIVKLFANIDVRSEESGNMGAMNTLRMVKKHKNLSLAIFAFALVWIIDCLKAIIAVIICQKLFSDSTLALTLTTFFVILGHNYPVWLKGKGGRGASSLMGVLMYFNFPLLIYWLLVVFGASIITEIIIKITKKQKINSKIIFQSISNQILGRLLGEIIAVFMVYFVDRNLFWPVFFATILIIYRHQSRLTKQLTNSK
jgi:glycerol-3-phosphate acyltransferase PlsY